MTDFTLDIPVSQIKLGQIHNQAPFASESGHIQVRAKLGSRWTCGLIWQNAHNAGKQLNQIRGLIAALAGQENRLIIKPRSIAGWERAGIGSGSPVLAATLNAGSRTLDLDGAAPLITGYLQPGDLFSLGNELKMCTGTSSFDTDAGGECTVTFWPEARLTRAPGAAIEVADPQGVFRLQTQSDFDSGNPAFPHHDSPALDLVEDINP